MKIGGFPGTNHLLNCCVSPVSGNPLIGIEGYETQDPTAIMTRFNLCVFLFSGTAFPGLYFRGAQPASCYSGGPAPLIDFIVAGARMLGSGFDFFSEVAMIASAGVAAVSLVLLTLSIAMFYTGRALEGRQPWARVVGMI